MMSPAAMPSPDAPPPLPAIELEVTEDYTARSKCDEGYLRIKRRKLIARYNNGEKSVPFDYDVVGRWNQDAVAILLHSMRNGVRHVILRSALRPPLSLRDDLLQGAVRYPNGVERGELWEIPAGIVEENERTPEGLIACAVRETEEEVGLKIAPSDVRALGGVMFPSAGIVGECVFLFEAEVDAGSRGEPEGDGPLERGARVIEVPLDKAIAWCNAGELPDAKTELSLRRLAAKLAGAL
jgi:ADP-ribose pyrophosphatase